MLLVSRPMTGTEPLIVSRACTTSSAGRPAAGGAGRQQQWHERQLEPAHLCCLWGPRQEALWLESQRVAPVALIAVHAVDADLHWQKDNRQGRVGGWRGEGMPVHSCQHTQATVL